MIPVITFFPFSLVGAIGSLAALDYLGFGLPPPTPSWGELLFQAQQYRWAWWLILYPSHGPFSGDAAGGVCGRRGAECI
jgi:microcin C transport system permease protein